MTIEIDGVKRAEFVDPERLTAAEPYARRVGLLLAKGDYGAAKRVIDLAAAELEEIAAPLAEMTMSEIGVSVRLANKLEHLGVQRVKDLLHVRTAELLSLGSVGDRSVDEIFQAVLKAAGAAGRQP